MSEPAEPVGPARQNDKIMMIVLAYLWVLALVPLLSGTTDKDVLWHARHGVVLTVVELAALIAWITMMSFAWLMTGGLFGCIVTLELALTPTLGLLIVSFHGYLIVKALQGERVLIPRISEFADRF